MDPARDVAQLLERRRDLAARLLEPRARVGVVVQLALEQAQLERQRHEPLLRAVVEVALEALALLLAGLDHPRARAPAAPRAGPQLGLQAPVLERDPRCRADRFEQLAAPRERRVVKQRRDVHAVAVDQRRRPVRPGSGSAPAGRPGRPSVSNSGSQ